jgi:membrane peptidoglycan carboxypeptidase
MGYDDNTPLTGVTGGGLPAEIWKETMLRVHEGLEPRPLPMQEPEGVARARAEEEERKRQAKQAPQKRERVIDRILKDIFTGEPKPVPENDR